MATVFCARCKKEIHISDEMAEMDDWLCGLCSEIVLDGKDGE